MAKVLGTIEAQFSGKVGDKVYYKYNGITCVRKAPTVKSDVRTPRQLINQHRFKEINRFCRELLATHLLRLWNEAAVNTTGYRLFLKSNAPAFTSEGAIGDYKLLKLTAGSLPLPFDIRTQREVVEGNSIRVSWKQDFHFSGERLRDELKYIALSNGIFSEITPTGLTRRSCGGTFELPINFDTATHLYLFFVSNDQRDYSDSLCYAL